MDEQTNLETNFRKWGTWSLASFGLGFLIISISSFIVLLVDLNKTSGTLFIAYLILMPALAIQMYLGIILIKIGKSFGQRALDSSQLYQFAKLYSIIFVISGVSLVFNKYSLTSGILLFIGGILANIGVRSFSSKHLEEKSMGGILGIITASLIVASLSFVPMGAVPTGMFSYMQISSGIGIIPFSGIPLLIAAIGAFIYARFRDKTTESISYIILAVSSLIFGIGIIINTLEPLTSSYLWNSFGQTSESDIVLSLFVAGAIPLVISGFLTVAASVIGIVILSSKGFPSLIPITSKPEEEFNVCPNCGAKVPTNIKFCANCGTEIKAKKEIFCRVCGAIISPQQKFCGSCGAKIEEVRKQEMKLTCPKCGFNIKAGDKFCERCGNKLGG